MNRVDPYGLEGEESPIRDTPTPGATYIDQVLGGLISLLKYLSGKGRLEPVEEQILDEIKPAVEVVEKLLDLGRKEGIEVRVHYVDGRITDFAAHAAKNGPDAVNIYIGHGLGDIEADRASEKVTETVRELLSEAAGHFGLFCCWPGSFNSAIPEENRIPGAWMADGMQTVADLTRYLSSVMAQIAELVESLTGDEHTVTVHVYFGRHDEGDVEGGVPYSGWEEELKDRKQPPPSEGGE